MGLSLSALRFIIRQHLHRPLGPAVCTLGRQRVVATYQQVLDLVREEGWAPRPLEDGQDVSTNIPSWKNGPESKNTSDVVFFGLLGIDTLTTLDVSDYEAADIIWDLNKPIPTELIGRFDTVIDSGTIEHVHDVHQAIRNINLLTRPGGTVMHFAPTSNYIDHGYHQLSPIFFVDYYAANRFERCDAWLFEHIRPFATLEKWNLYRHEYGLPMAPWGWLWSSKAWMTAVVAYKGEDSTVDKVPIQGGVVLPWASNRPVAAGGRTRLFSSVRRRLEPLARRSTFLWKCAVTGSVVMHYIIRRRATRHAYVGKL